MMLAAVLTPEGEFSLERVPRPVPRAGEVLVRVRSCGVCHSDLHVARGEIAFPRPAVLGHEISGTVVELGPDVAATGAGPDVGTAVVGAFIMPCTTCEACRRGRDDLCAEFFAQNRTRGVLFDGTSRLSRVDGTPLAMYSMGGLAEFAVCPVSALAPLPEGVEPRSAAILGCAGMTAYGAVTRAGQVGPGDAVGVVAVGGLGLSMVQLAAGSGAETVVAVDVDDRKLDLARSLGATHTVNSASVDALTAIRELTGGRGLDVTIEALGRPETLRLALEALADGGRAVAVGLAATGVEVGVEITPFVRRSRSLLGSYGARTRTDLPAIVDRAAAGAFDPARVVTDEFPLRAVAEAYAALGRGEIRGRAIVTMD